MLKFILATKSCVVILSMLLAATAQAESCKGAIGTYERLICENTKSLTLSIIESRKPFTYYNPFSELMAQRGQSAPCSAAGVSTNYQNEENLNLRAQNQALKAQNQQLWDQNQKLKTMLQQPTDRKFRPRRDPGRW